ncbi:hypothetical protein GWK08_06135 [Leptobacterium flavescens]|uniref:Uncharacterized protein n=1 Tax=Leptobacterium flavescens TaxID=472055 RepID=A0A6P0UMD4_9FLAO|nr:hypothetical protein [Leptobacterium flavescens]NER13009.1 hypothetical protein [Leptobacterium flavescens]
MKKKEELFYLIKSLSKSEKRYFKLDVAGVSEAEYLALFQAIEAQSTYDEEEIKEMFRNRKFVLQLTTIKNYLKNRILLSLRNYHSRISVNAELLDIIRNIEILFHKGLYTLCESELKRAEKKAELFQHHLWLFHIQDWKRKVHQALHPQDFERMKDIVSEQKKALESTTDYIELLLANIDPGKFSLTHKSSTSLHNKTLEMLYLFRKQLSLGNSKEAKRIIGDILEEWESEPILFREYFITYFSVCNTYIAFLLFEGSYEIATERIRKLKRQSSGIRPVSAALIKEKLRLYNIELEICRDLKRVDIFEEIIAEIRTFTEDHKDLIPHNYWLSFRFQFAYLYFLKGDHRFCLKWVNHILNHHSRNDRKDLIRYTYWLNLLLHYERENVFVIRHLIDAMKRYLKNQKNIASYEKKLLYFLSKTVGYPSKEKQEAFKKLEKDLVEDPIPKEILGYIDFNLWIKGKLEG